METYVTYAVVGSVVLLWILITAIPIIAEARTAKKAGPAYARMDDLVRRITELAETSNRSTNELLRHDLVGHVVATCADCRRSYPKDPSSPTNIYCGACRDRSYADLEARLAAATKAKG